MAPTPTVPSTVISGGIASVSRAATYRMALRKLAAYPAANNCSGLVPRRLCRKFSLEAICGMVSPRNIRDKEKKSDHGGELQGGPFPQGYHPDGCALVCRVSLELSAYRRTHGGARGCGGSLHSPALGRQIQSPLGRGVPSPQ